MGQTSSPRLAAALPLYSPPAPCLRTTSSSGGLRSIRISVITWSGARVHPPPPEDVEVVEEEEVVVVVVVEEVVVVVVVVVLLVLVLVLLAVAGADDDVPIVAKEFVDGS